MDKKKYIQLELPFEEFPVEEKANPAKAVPPASPRGAEKPVDTRIRAKRRRIKVSFDDGTTFCDVSATATMIMTIEKIGVERVAALNMDSCHVPLVSRHVVDRYAEWTKPIVPGWYLMAQGDTPQKYLQLKSIIKALSVNATIELGDFETLASKENVHKGCTTRRKVLLAVTLPDGRVISGNVLHTFKQAIWHIGVDKVEKTNLKIGGNPITTPVKRYNNQIQLSSAKWLTVPASVKDKYKILRTLSVMTRTPFEVKILE